MGIAASIAACGCSKKNDAVTGEAEIISPDALITATDATEVAGAAMSMDVSGVRNDGGARIVDYYPTELGAADPVSVRIEQFSDTLSVSQVWEDYENHRVSRSGDAQMITGVGQDCYVTYPYINIYDRGCYIRISAGSGDSEAQRDMLVNLANRAVLVLEEKISADAVPDPNDNVIK